MSVMNIKIPWRIMAPILSQRRHRPTPRPAASAPQGRLGSPLAAWLVDLAGPPALPTHRVPETCWRNRPTAAARRIDGHLSEYGWAHLGPSEFTLLVSGLIYAPGDFFGDAVLMSPIDGKSHRVWYSWGLPPGFADKRTRGTRCPVWLRYDGWTIWVGSHAAMGLGSLAVHRAGMARAGAGG